jgi:hypothetical protein
VPVVVLAVVAAVAIVPNSKDPAAPSLDLLGTVLSTTGLMALLFGIIQGPADGWGDRRIGGSFAAAAVLLTASVLWERRCPHPILEVSFFADARFTAASVAVTLVFFAMFGSLFFVSQFLQFVLGYTPLRSGVALLPVAGVLMIAAPTSAKLVARRRTRPASRSAPPRSSPGKLPAATARAVTRAANEAFVDALSVSVIVASDVAFLGAVVAAVFLPSRPVIAAEPGLTPLIDEAAQRLDTRSAATWPRPPSDRSPTQACRASPTTGSPPGPASRPPRRPGTGHPGWTWTPRWTN